MLPHSSRTFLDGNGYVTQRVDMATGMSVYKQQDSMWAEALGVRISDLSGLHALCASAFCTPRF